MPKESYLKWFLEGLTYRIGDLLIGFTAGFCVTLFVTHDFGNALEIGSLISIVENALNTGYYLLNRWLWSKTDKRWKK